MVTNVIDKTLPTGDSPDSVMNIVDKSISSLEGRTVDKAGLKKPQYTTQVGGTVVVDIWVDQYGKVVKAIPGTDGTTVEDKDLWNASRAAALETGANMKADAPTLKKGTIT